MHSQPHILKGEKHLLEVKRKQRKYWSLAHKEQIREKTEYWRIKLFLCFNLQEKKSVVRYILLNYT